MEKYKFLECNTGIKLLVFGRTIEEAFENSAYAMIEVIHSEKVEDALVTRLKVVGGDYERLLHNFLEQILFLLNSEKFMLNKINRISKIRTNKDGDFELIADISGDDARKYKLDLDIKAITYNEMFVKSPLSTTNTKFRALKTSSFSSQEKKKWICQVVLGV
jgi:SHS2 domain-containing protein